MMEAFDAKTLRAGARLPGSLFTRQGVKLLAAEVTLTESMCRTLGQFEQGDLYLAGSIDELRRAGVVRATPTALLPRAGDAAAADLVTLGGVLAVESGDRVDEQALDALELGAFVGIDPKESARLRSSRMKLADDIAADREERWSRLALTVEREPADAAAADASSDAGATDQAEIGRAWPGGAALTQWRSVRVSALRRAMARVLTGVPTHVAEFEVLTDELIELCRAHPERFAQVALCAIEREEFLPDHAYTVAALSVAIAVRMGFNERGVRHAALAGMLCDVGMGLIPASVRSSTRTLDEIDSNRVRRHPAFSVMLLDSVEGLDDEVSLAAYQHQERENGSGYPRGLKSKQISEITKVVSVADVFAASVGPRPYRPTKRAYDALEELIAMGSDKLLERKMVRALVEATGLFPVGSYVRLSTGDLAEVVGAHATMIDRPVVTVLKREGRTLRAGATIDLADHKPWELHVILAADAPTENVVRA
jgi:HD-GYP domain-containing protein (c-di-GMP phosphodiesterase class II)